MARTKKINVEVLYSHINQYATSLHRVIMYNGHKFKISCTNGNSYSHVVLSEFCTNGTLQQLAQREEITDVYCNYICNNDERIQLMEQQYADCIKYIMAVFPER